MVTVTLIRRSLSHGGKYSPYIFLRPRVPIHSQRRARAVRILPFWSVFFYRFRILEGAMVDRVEARMQPADVELGLTAPANPLPQNPLPPSTAVGPAKSMTAYEVIECFIVLRY